MVGGIVIGVTRTAEKAHVTVADCPHYPSHGRGDECPRPDTCSVHTDEVKCHGQKRVEVQVGDSFWWQAGHCYWTPSANRGKGNAGKGNARGGVDYDIQLTKIGFSH